MELLKRHADVGAAVVEERGVSAGVVHVVLEHGGGTAGACDIEDVELDIDEVQPGRDDDVDEGVLQLDHGRFSFCESES